MSNFIINQVQKLLELK